MINLVLPATLLSLSETVMMRLVPQGHGTVVLVGPWCYALQEYLSQQSEKRDVKLATYLYHEARSKDERKSIKREITYHNIQTGSVYSMMPLTEASDHFRRGVTKADAIFVTDARNALVEISNWFNSLKHGGILIWNNYGCLDVNRALLELFGPQVVNRDEDKVRPQVVLYE